MFSVANKLLVAMATPAGSAQKCCMIHSKYEQNIIDFPIGNEQ